MRQRRILCRMLPCRSPAPAPASRRSVWRTTSWPASRRSSFPEWPATQVAPPGWGAGLPPAPDLPEMPDLARNGTYLVLRDLRQDVRGFWQYLDKQAEESAETRQRLAQAMVGREMSGAPLLPPAAQPIPGIDSTSKGPANQFTFEDDATGAGCPLGAHIRRANPRNADLPGGATGFLRRVLRVLG